MNFNKCTLFSALGLSAFHFLLVIALMKFRPDFLATGDMGSLADKTQAVLMQPGVWTADFMGCVGDKPMWWIFLLLNSALWGNAAAFVIRTFFKRSCKSAD